MHLRHRFASREWVDELRRVVLDHCASVDLTGVEYSLSEELTDPPLELARDDGRPVGWHLRIADGVVEVEDAPLADATVRIVADYATVEPIARIVLGRGSGARRSVDRMLEAARSAGRFTLFAEAVEPAVLRGLDLHDVMAVRTA